jgi:transcriptional regulator with XRE-family HTH domain
MENILMRFCRQTNRYNLKSIAAKLHISVDTYRGIERGDILLTEKQARELGKLYNVQYSYFFREALQLDLLLTRKAIIRILKWEVDLLIKKNKKEVVAAS